MEEKITRLPRWAYVRGGVQSPYRISATAVDRALRDIPATRIGARPYYTLTDARTVLGDEITECALRAYLAEREKGAA